MKRIFSRVQIRLDQQAMLALFAFAVNIFLVFNVFLPTLRDLNFWDEAVYLNTGRLLVGGQLPSFARNPLIGTLYALTYLPFLNAPLWMVYSASWGRFILFGLMWWSSYLIARQFVKFALPLTMAGFLLIFPILIDILVNSSDALFAAMSGFAFWQLVRFYNTKEIRNLGWGSFFLGLAALSRNDGLVLFVLFLGLAGVIAWNVKLHLTWILPGVLPFVLLVGGYFLFYGSITGDFSLGTKERSYVAFQQGQSTDYQKDPTCKEKWLRCAVLQAEQLYGTGEQNDYSIFKAISRNPNAYVHRLTKQISVLPEMIYEVFGKRTGILLYILAFRGLLKLLRRRQYLLTALLVLWPLHLAIYFLTFFRIGYFRLPYFIFYVLGMIGVSAFIADARNRKGLYIWSGLLIAATVVAAILDMRAVYFTTFLLLVGIWFVHFIARSSEDVLQVMIAGSLVILIVGLILRPVLDPPAPRDLYQGAEEQAVMVMQKQFPRGSLVLAGAPGGVWAARMEFLDANDFAELNSGADLYTQLKEKGVSAIFVDPYLSNVNEQIWTLIEPDIGKWYETLYIGREGSIRVLRVNP